MNQKRETWKKIVGGMSDELHLLARSRKSLA